jgi:hypothetical protein
VFSFCLVADYAQNLGLPHFGGEQPGDTYYYSPLAVYCFGLVDASQSPEQLHCFGYTEDEGAKGGNNVASLIMKALKDMNWISPGKCGNRLSFIMDNCSGQNKNGHVLRLALLLVELGYFKKVEFIFYVRGHTKNLCDRMFNLLKKRYHPSQIYSKEALSDLLNALDNINYYQVTSEVFFDYNALLSQFYKPFPGGSIKQNHFFWVDERNATTMCSVTHHNDEDSDVVMYDHCIPMQDRQRLIMDAIDILLPLPAPGMKPIKQVELWKKWGQFIPEDERHHLCPRPPDDVINQVTSERSSRQQERIRSRNNNASQSHGQNAAQTQPQRKRARRARNHS